MIYVFSLLYLFPPQSYASTSASQSQQSGRILSGKYSGAFGRMVAVVGGQTVSENLLYKFSLAYMYMYILALHRVRSVLPSIPKACGEGGGQRIVYMYMYIYSEPGVYCLQQNRTCRLVVTVTLILTSSTIGGWGGCGAGWRSRP